MKKTLYIFLLSLFCIRASAQITITVNPTVDTPIEPTIPVLLQFTFTGTSAVDWTIEGGSSLKGCTVDMNLQTNGQARVRFTDVKEVHEILLRRPATGDSRKFTFTKIMTVDGIKPAYPTPTPPGINPFPPYDDIYDEPWIGPCANGSFSFTGPTVRYKDASGVEFGNPMAFYELIVPKGWKVGNVVSDGITPIDNSTPTASITPDPLTGGMEEIKFRAKNNLNPNAYARSAYYRAFIDRPKIELQVNGQNPVPITCGENIVRTFGLNNLALSFSSCVVNSYTWNLGVVPNRWLYNGSAAPASVTTTTPYIDLQYAGTLAAPSPVSVTFTGTNGTSYTFTAPISYTPCTSTIFSAPLGVLAVCGVQTQSTLSVTTNGNLSEITGYAWNFGAVPNKWNDNTGIAMPATMNTSVNSVTVVSDGSTTGPPSNISVTPMFNGTPGPFTYNIPVTYRNCCENPPTNPTPVFSNSNGWVILNWDPVVAATTYTVEYMTVSGGNNQTLTTSSPTLNYYGPAYEDAKFRVKATCSNGITSDWTAWKTFPANADCNLSPLSIGYSLLGNRNVQINWGAVPGASSYNVKLEPYGSTPPGTVTNNGLTTTSTVLTAPYANGAYYTISVQPVCFYSTTHPAPWVQMGTPASVYYRTAGNNPNTPIVIQINETTKITKKISVSPNPASNIAALTFNSDISGFSKLTVLDMSGRTVVEQDIVINKGANKRDVDISNLKGGMYYVTIYSKEGNMTSSFVKQ